MHRSGDGLGKRPPGYMGDVSHRHSYEASVEEGGVGQERMVGDLSVGAVLDDGISTEGDGARERLSFPERAGPGAISGSQEEQQGWIGLAIMGHDS